MEAKIRRQVAMAEARKTLVLEAAKVVFSKMGLERASMREIAKQAGYTVGALYSYFASRQVLLAALLADMLSRLETVVWAVRAPKGQADALLLARGQAWLTFFIAQPHDTELMLYVLTGAGGRREQSELGRQLHLQLRKTLEPLSAALLTLGASPVQLDTELEAMLAHGLGLLVAQDTNRLQAAEQSPEALFARYLNDVANRYQTVVVSTKAGLERQAAPQVDLFR